MNSMNGCGTVHGECIWRRVMSVTNGSQAEVTFWTLKVLFLASRIRVARTHPLRVNYHN